MISHNLFQSTGRISVQIDRAFPPTTVGAGRGLDDVVDLAVLISGDDFRHRVVACGFDR